MSRSCYDLEFIRFPDYKKKSPYIFQEMAREGRLKKCVLNSTNAGCTWFVWLLYRPHAVCTVYAVCSCLLLLSSCLLVCLPFAETLCNLEMNWVFLSSYQLGSSTVMKILCARMFKPRPILRYISHVATKTSKISKMLSAGRNRNPLLEFVKQSYAATDHKCRR